MALNYYFNPDVTRFWMRWYMYHDLEHDGVWKMCITRVAGDYKGGLLMNGQGNGTGWMSCSHYDEWGSRHHNLISMTGLNAQWNWVELDYWRVGDTGGDVITTGDGEPSMAIWFNGVQFTQGLSSPPSPGYWKNGRIYAGGRDQQPTDSPVTTANFMANSTPAGTVASNVYVDRVSISTLGRIGP